MRKRGSLVGGPTQGRRHFNLHRARPSEWIGSSEICVSGYHDCRRSAALNMCAAALASGKTVRRMIEVWCGRTTATGAPPRRTAGRGSICIVLTARVHQDQHAHAAQASHEIAIAIRAGALPEFARGQQRRRRTVSHGLRFPRKIASTIATVASSKWQAPVQGGLRLATVLRFPGD
jgi:hypothetical protein